MRLLVALLPVALAAAPITLAPRETGYQTFNLSWTTPDRLALLAVFDPADVGATVSSNALAGLVVAPSTQQGNGLPAYPVGVATGLLGGWNGPLTSISVRITNTTSDRSIRLREIHVSAEGRVAAGWQSVGGNPTASLALEPQIAAPVISNPEPTTFLLTGCGLILLIWGARRVV
jgi:hypothetical protein